MSASTSSRKVPDVQPAVEQGTPSKKPLLNEEEITRADPAPDPKPPAPAAEEAPAPAAECCR